jgi:hypothetical protein
MGEINTKDTSFENHLLKEKKEIIIKWEYENFITWRWLFI